MFVSSRLAFIAAVLAATLPSVRAAAQPAVKAETPVMPADEKSIRENAAAYVAAFNNRDAQAMTALWSPDAVYLNRLTGEQVAGRDAIAKQIEAQLKAAGKVKLEVVVDQVDFVSPNVAIERGTTRFIPEKGEPEESQYSAVDVKRDGKWLLDRVTEESGPAATPARAKLRELAWLVGSWKVADPNSQLETDCHWARNENFLILAFKLSIAGRTRMAGIQVIGYDAAKKQFRSWVFDSDGGFAEGLWKQQGKQWFIHQNGTLPDGRTSTAVNAIRKIDDNTFSWESMHREIDGRIEPNVDPIRMARQ